MLLLKATIFNLDTEAKNNNGYTAKELLNR